MMRTIAISDIHGCYNELKSLLAILETKGKYNKDTDRLIFLGDYVDRGEDSRKVIQLIRSLQKDNDNVIALMGNHEDMMIGYLNGIKNWWNYNGSDSTLKSYRMHKSQLKDDLEWMSNLPLYYEDDYFIYVHAGVDVNKTMEEQSRHDLLWTREPFLSDATPYYKRVVFGHTPTLNFGTDKPVYTSANNIGIDTGCVYYGALTALVIEDDKVECFYQVEMEDNKKYNV